MTGGRWRCGFHPHSDLTIRHDAGLDLNDTLYGTKVRRCNHRCKKNFFNVFNVFLFSKRFFIFKNVCKVQSGKQINKKHFKNSNEIDLWFFCCMSNDLKCFPINFYLLTMFDALCDGLEGHFLGIRRTALRRGNIFCYVHKRFFIFVTFFTFLTFFIWTFFLNLWMQLTQCRFPGRAISNAKMLIYFSNKIHGSNFIEQHWKTVMV